MKRLFALVLTAAMVLALAGCGLATQRGIVVDKDIRENGSVSVLIREIVPEGEYAGLYRESSELPDDIAVGDVVEVLYRGGVQETFPASFSEVWSVTIVEEFDENAPEIGIVSGDREIEPTMTGHWAETWADGGWIAADYEVPTLEELVEGGLPSIVYGEDLAINVRNDVSITSFAVRDEALEYIEEIDGIEGLAALAPGRYFVRLGYEKRGEYIDEARDFNTSGGSADLELVVE